jgi:hypothetical protein
MSTDSGLFGVGCEISDGQCIFWYSENANSRVLVVYCPAVQYKHDDIRSMLTQTEIARFKILILMNSRCLSFLHELQPILLGLVHGDGAGSTKIPCHHVLQFNRKSSA